MGGTGLLRQAVQENPPEGTRGLQTGPWRAGSRCRHGDMADVSGRGGVAETSGGRTRWVPTWPSPSVT